MLRRFTQDVGRWKAGSLHDWPQSTWTQVAKDSNKPLEAISAVEEISQIHTLRNRQGAKIRARADAGRRGGVGH